MGANNVMPAYYERKLEEQGKSAGDGTQGGVANPDAIRNDPFRKVSIPMVSKDQSVYDSAIAAAEAVKSEDDDSSRGAAYKSRGKSVPVVGSATAAPIEGAPDRVVERKEYQLDLKKYAKFRTEMFAYMLQEAAYDYAEELYREHPEDPTVMAFLTETVWLYEKKKIITRKHWIDRMELMQRGLDVSRRCIDKYPEYLPCYRNYVVLATKMSDQYYWFRWRRFLGNVDNYEGIMKLGNKALELSNYQDFETAIHLAELNGRVATKWYSPYRWYGMMFQIPDKWECFRRAKYYHWMANKMNPEDIENSLRLAMVYYEEGQFAKARRWYTKCRDGLAATDERDEYLQGVAHTHLCTRFVKSKWNFYKFDSGKAV